MSHFSRLLFFLFGGLFSVGSAWEMEFEEVKPPFRKDATEKF